MTLPVSDMKKPKKVNAKKQILNTFPNSQKMIVTTKISWLHNLKEKFTKRVTITMSNYKQQKKTLNSRDTENKNLIVGVLSHD